MQITKHFHCPAKDEDVTVSQTFLESRTTEGTTEYVPGRYHCSNVFCDHVGCDIHSFMQGN